MLAVIVRLPLGTFEVERYVNPRYVMSSERSGSDAFRYFCMGRHFRFFASLHRECYRTPRYVLLSWYTPYFIVYSTTDVVFAHSVLYSQCSISRTLY